MGRGSESPPEVRFAETRRTWRFPRGARRSSIVLFLSVAMLSATVAMPWSAGAAGLVGGDYQLTWDQSTDRTETAETTTRTMKQTVNLKYRGLLSPVVENEIALKVEEEKKTDTAGILRVNPIVTLNYRGGYWSAGAKDSIEDSNEVGKNPKISKSYFAEFYFKPARPSLPDLKGKYTLDMDTEKEATDTQKQAIALSSIYKPIEPLNFRGEYSRTTNKDFLKVDSDTEEEKMSFTSAFRMVLRDKIKLNSEYKVETTHGATLKSDGTGATPGSDKQDQSHTWKNTLAYQPFPGTSIDASEDLDLRLNIVSGEHDIVWSSRASIAQKVLTPIDVKATVNRIVTDTRFTGDDNRKTEDTYGFEFKAKFNKLLDFNGRYEKKNTVEDHVNPAKDTGSGTATRSGSWTGDLTPFWKASASMDRSDTIANKVTTIVESKYSLKTTFDLRRINLTIDPSYDIDLKDDRVKPEKSATRDFKFRVAYRILSTNNIEVRFDHTFGRKKDTSLENITRTDSTNGNILWKDPIPGLALSFDLTRSASDTSQDDLPPDVTVSMNTKAEFRYRMLSLASSMKYDKKNPGDNSETIDFKVGWVAPRWDIFTSYSFRKTFSALLNEGYSINLTFKYNL